MKNSHNKPAVGSKSLIFMFSLLLATGYALKPLLASSEDEKSLRDKAKAESLGYQLLQLQANTVQPAGGRGPASVSASEELGEIGVDPWGMPYSYRLVRTQTGETQLIEVWSSHMNDRVQVQVKR